MERSIAARYAARSVARFVRPSSRARESRLGLHAAGGFHPAPTGSTVVHSPHGHALTHLRGGWRAFRAATPRRAAIGRIRPSVAMRWTGSAGVAGAARSSAATAPWRG
jgi:hypothetical protein